MRLLFFLLAALLAAPSSAQVVLARQVIGGGATVASSPDGLSLRGTVGQPAVGTIGNANVTLRHGFWHGGAVSDGGGAPLPLVASYDGDPPGAGDTFTVVITAGSAASPVSDLFGISFTLSYDPALVSFVSAEPGAFLADGASVLEVEDDGSMEVAYGVTRQRPAGGVDGFGPVAAFTFLIADAAMPGASASFKIGGVLAGDADGSAIAFETTDATIVLEDLPRVWPGDTDNNGVVEAADLLPIGQYFGSTGPARQDAYNPTWEVQRSDPWTPEAATYADATGHDGVVNQADILPIGINYGCKHTAGVGSCGLGGGQTGLTAEAPTGHSATSEQLADADPTTNASLSLSQSDPLAVVPIDARPAGQRLDITLSVPTAPASGLLGVASTWTLPPTLTLVEAAPGGALDDGDLLAFQQWDAEAGQLDVAYSRKAGNETPDGGEVLRLTLEVVAEMAGPAEVVLARAVASSPVGTDGTGGSVPLSATDVTTASTPPQVTAEEGDPTAIMIGAPYPNPVRGAASIAIAVPEPVRVSISLYDARGRRVAVVADGERAAGRHEVVVDTAGLARGLYLVRFEVEGEPTVVRTLAIVR